MVIMSPFGSGRPSGRRRIATRADAALGMVSHPSGTCMMGEVVDHELIRERAAAFVRSSPRAQRVPGGRDVVIDISILDDGAGGDPAAEPATTFPVTAA